MNAIQEKAFFVRAMLLIMLSQTFLVLMMFSSDVRIVLLVLTLLLGVIGERIAFLKVTIKENFFFFKNLFRSISIVSLIICFAAGFYHAG